MQVTINGTPYVASKSLPMADMPKLESPFVRVTEGRRRIVTPEIAPGYEWVFEDPSVLAVEKLDGTNVSVGMQRGSIVALFNRTPPQSFDTLDNNRYIAGVRLAHEKCRLPLADGQHFGELMGPKVQTNFLQLAAPEWFPFYYLQATAVYRSWGRYPKDFETISAWFRNDLFSLVYQRLHGEKVWPEGIVFWQPSTGRMAKLRRDTFDWYTGAQH
jgi:hypothetical protein